MKGHIYLWQEISSYDKKYLPATRNFFVWQEINAFDKRFLPMTINFFLWKLITCSAKKFLPVTKNISCMLCVIRRISLFDRKYRPLSQICAKTTWNADKISCESEDFVGAWLPGSRLISHPGPCLVGLNIPVHYPPVQSGLRRTRHLVYFLLISWCGYFAMQATYLFFVLTKLHTNAQFYVFVWEASPPLTLHNRSHGTNMSTIAGFQRFEFQRFE